MQSNIFNTGDIVLVPFPFTDLSSSKTRPAVILSSVAEHNTDYILGAISSKAGDNDISIDCEDCIKGGLPLKSYFKLGKLVTIDSQIITKKIAVISDTKKQEVLESTRSLF